MAIERRYERREGTATYLGFKAAVIATQSPAKKTIEILQEGQLKKSVDSFEKFPSKDAPYFRWRQYGTGGAICMILEKLEVKNWNQDVERGSRLDELLAAAVDFNPKRDSSLVKNALKKYGYEDLLKK